MELKEYFQKPYQGGASFLEKVIFPIFGKEDWEDAYEEDILQTHPHLIENAEQTGVRSIIRLGTIQLPFNETNIFDVTVSDHVQMARNRVAIQLLIRRIMTTYSSAFMIFHYDNDDMWDWRFTFCNKQDGKEQMTDSKRYTFLLGPNQSCRTAAENFNHLAQCPPSEMSLEKIIEAFDVEALSKEFFNKYKMHYLRFVDYMCDEENGMREDFIDHSTSLQEGMSEEERIQIQERPIRNYVKKLLGRIVFLHFLQKKGWMGVPRDKNWGEGDLQFMLHLFEKSSPEQQENFLDEVLEPLFSDALDTDRSRNNDLFDTHVQLDGGSLVKIPYLNGGLFEKDYLDAARASFPANYFKDLLEFFYQYNFTIDENDPNDAQVGIDPEMLGRIFENLLEDNKDKGTYYTPKEIVQYMCKQSLIAYLQTEAGQELEEPIAEFVKDYDIQKLKEQGPELVETLNQKLKEVKVCDPTIGSGAFPMGMLKELFYCRGAIEQFDNAPEIKKHIIQNNIYGVDIEKGAVDIARLRFWLSLIVDEDTPHSLPNLDYKIMQGNSLLESYKGVDLSLLTDQKQQQTGSIQISIFENKLDLLRKDLKSLTDAYYNESDHSKKLQIRKEIQKNVQQQLSENYYDLDLSDIDVSENSYFFLWHTWFSDVFKGKASNNGFDIVIGNPPYVQLQNNAGKYAELYKECKYQTFARTGDLYCLFYERGWQLLKPNGHLCYITSNKWMRAGYGVKTREFLAKNTNPMILIDFAGTKLFENVTVDANILLFSRSENQHQTHAVTLDRSHKNSIKNLSVYVQQHHSICDFYSSDSWVILSKIEQSIKQKIEAIGTPLKEWDINIYRGILTGFNEAFIISTEKRDEILQNCKSEDERRRTEELIRPILRGRDIKRYDYDWAGLYLIYIPWHFPLHLDPSIKGASQKAEKEFERLYPSVYGHMLCYKDRLSKRNKAETGIRYEWYALQRWGANYWEEFDKPKIVYPNMTKYMPFYFDTNNFFVNQKCFILTGKHLEYLATFFNSNIFKICYKDSFPELQGGTRELSKIFFEKILIPRPEDLISEDFIRMIEDRIKGKDYADIRIEKALIISLDLYEYEDFILNYQV